MMEESGMKEFLTIKEFSELSGVEYSTLRYWDDIGLFSPIWRDPENNYRYYKPEQLISLNFVTTLSDIEVQLKTIGELKNNRDPQKFIDMIDKQEKLINGELNKLRTSYAIIHARRELVSYGLKNNFQDETIAVMRREDKKYNLGPRNEYKEGETFIDALANLVPQVNDLHINLSFPVGGLFDSLDSFIDHPKQPEYFTSVDPTGARVRKASNYLVGFTRGYYGEFGDLPQKMKDYAKEKSIAVTGPLYVMYLHDEICMQEHDKYLVQCHVAIKKTKK